MVDALRQSGYDFAPGHAGLDFGCSSGRVVRVLAAAGPEIAWYGCDPIPDAIEWAQANLPGVSFARSPERPPLPYEDHRFDFVFAISIWSHFAEGAALAWLAEMRRIIKPGGRLLITTHGEQTMAHTHREGSRSADQLERGARRPVRRRLSGTPPSSARPGDHGVANPDWGTAFLTAGVAAGQGSRPNGGWPSSGPAAWRGTRTSTCSSRGRRHALGLGR